MIIVPNIGYHAFGRYIQRMRIDCIGTHSTNDINDNVDPSIRHVCQSKICDILEDQKIIRSYQIIESLLRCVALIIINILFLVFHYIFTSFGVFGLIYVSNKNTILKYKFSELLLLSIAM